MLSRFFIDRPVFASVISIIIVLAGTVAMGVLPIAQYPDIVPPTVSVSSVFTGANAETVANTVSAPMEQQITGVEGMIYHSSANSSSGESAITVTFEIGTNPDDATVNTQNRQKLAEPQIPEDVRRNGVTVRKKSSNMLLVVTVRSPDGSFDDVFTSNYASLYIIDELKRLPGAGDVAVFGGRDYAMRIWLNPDRMAQLGLTAGDVARAVREQNQQFAAGRVGQQPSLGPQQLTFSVTTQGRLIEPQQFEEIVLRANPDGSMIRLKDIGRAELGTKEYETRGLLNGKPATLITVYQQPGANALALADAVRETMDRLSANFPKGIEYSIPYDTTRFVEISIEEVIHTLFEAVILVLVVVFVFLQSFRATLVPLIAVPISLIGTFAGMYLLGFSINTLTLFGMVLAIGIVVDDAIVVVENVERLMHEKRLSAKEAAYEAMAEVTGPVIAIVLVLVSVFVPVAFLGGMTGLMYQQFAVTVAVSVVLSGIVALTLSPALAALLLKEKHGEPSRFFKAFNSGFEWLTNWYTTLVRLVLRNKSFALMMFGAVLAGTVMLFKHVPGSFVPEEDQGYLVFSLQLPEGASLVRTSEALEKVEAIVQEHPDVADVISFAGFDLIAGQNKSRTASLFVILEDWSKRPGEGQGAAAVLRDILSKTIRITDGTVLGFNPPSIPGLSTTGGFEFFIQSRGEGDTARLAGVAQEFLIAARARPELAGLTTTLRTSSPELFVEVDRAKAKALGVDLSEVFQTVQTAFGSLYVNDFNKFGRVYRVQLQAEPLFRSNPDDVERLFVRSQSGQMLPLSSIVTLSYRSGPEAVDRFNGFPAARVLGRPASGYASGEAIKAMEEVARSLPEGYSYEWSGEYFQQKRASSSAGLVFGFGVVMVFLILAAQYERIALPLSVILAVPLGLFGALFAVWLMGLANDVYFQIGLVTLIGLAAKNAILIVEFAVIKKAEGLSITEAAVQAAQLRFRPIVMTSLAFILGVVPLLTSSGAGAASRHSIGTGVFGGMVAATVLAVLFVPLFFVLFEREAPSKESKA